MVLQVRLDDGLWLADVGFGSGLLEPVRMSGDGPRQQGGWTLDVVRGEDSGWRLKERRGSEWATLMTVNDDPQYPVDVDVANHNTSTNPHSPFTQRPIAVRKDDTSLRSLLGRRFTVERPDGSSQGRDVTDAEFGTVLREQFGLDLSETELVTLVAGIPPHSPATGQTGKE